MKHLHAASVETYMCEHGNMHLIIECTDGTVINCAMDVRGAAMVATQMHDQILEFVGDEEDPAGAKPAEDGPTLN